MHARNRVSAATLQIGALIAIGLAAGFDLDVAGSYYLGVLGGVLYFFLLGKKVESIGANYSAMPNRPTEASAALTSNATNDDNEPNGCGSHAVHFKTAPAVILACVSPRCTLNGEAYGHCINLMLYRSLTLRIDA